MGSDRNIPFYIETINLNLGTNKMQVIHIFVKT
jgi:hypothetical protein